MQRTGSRAVGTPFIVCAPPGSFARQVFAVLKISAEIPLVPTVDQALRQAAVGRERGHRRRAAPDA